MTSLEDHPAAEPTNWRSLAIKTGIGAVAGALGAIGLMELIDSGALGALDTSREIAALVGMLYLMTAAVVGFGLVSPDAGSRLLNVEDADELREMRPMLRWSVLGTASIAAILFIAAFAAPAGPIGAPVALALVAILFVLACYTGHRQRAHTDELMRAVAVEGTSAAFYLTVVVGGGWALLAHLGYLAGPEPLDWLTMFASLMLLGCFVITIQRGLIRRS